jgi:hypothetical protein
MMRSWSFQRFIGSDPAPQLRPGAVTAFSFDPTDDVPFPSLVAEVTHEEFGLLARGFLLAPEGWTIDLESAREIPREPHGGEK